MKAHDSMTDDRWAAITSLLPPEPPKPKGSRPRVPDRAALVGILYVLRERDRAAARMSFVSAC